MNLTLEQLRRCTTNMHPVRSGTAAPAKPRRKPGGKALERLIEKTAPLAGIELVRIPQAAQRLPGNKIIAKRGPVDFVGCWSGQMVTLDAKECSLKRRFPIGNRTHLPDHQRRFLERMGLAGAHAGLIVHATAHDRFYWIGWHSLTGEHPSVPWHTLFECGHGQIDWGLLKKYWVTMGGGK